MPQPVRGVGSVFGRDLSPNVVWRLRAIASIRATVIALLFATGLQVTGKTSDAWMAPRI